MDMHDDDRTVGRILTRREIFKLVGATGLGLVAGCTSSSSGTGSTVLATPALTEGPFFVDERLNRSDITTGTTRLSVLNGTPLDLKINVARLNGSTTVPLTNAQVDIWHTDAIGTYSDVNNGGIQSENTLGQKWLRGHQNTDVSGNVQFKTIYPGWYIGRTIHIHFKVRQFDNVGNVTYEFSSQWFMLDGLSDTVMAGTAYNTRGARTLRNTNDGIFGTRLADNTTAGSHLILDMTPINGGASYSGAFNVILQI
jgi:protocatechuate 3,4-dioxygenase beta subunit